MLSITEQQNLNTLVDVLAHEPENRSVAEHVRLLKRAHPEAVWEVVFTDVRELSGEDCGGNVAHIDRWYGTALIALNIPGARLVTPGQSTGSSRFAATWGAVSNALTAAIEAELEEDSGFPRDADGCAIY